MTRARLLTVAAVLGACSALFFSCWSGKGPSQSGPSGPAAARTAAGPKQSNETRYTLETFAPVLAHPALGSARQAYEAGRFAAAARAVETAMKQVELDANEVLAWQFLLGRLREQAGEPAGAAASFDLASARPWPLSDYARVGAARALIRSGKHRDALQRLRSVPDGLAISPTARLLKAEASLQVGDRDLAAKLWREHLAAVQSPEDGPTVALALAGVLLDRVSARPAAAAPAAQAKTESQTLEAADDRDILEALRLIRRAQARGASVADIVRRATELEQRALSALPEPERARQAQPTPEDHLERARVLTEARDFPNGLLAAEALLGALPQRERWSPVACEGALLKIKALAGQKQWGRAVDFVGDHLRFCKDRALLPRLLFLAGTYAAADDRDAFAVQYFERLEKEFPSDRLADDARLRAAESYLALGSEARFTELLAKMADDYPSGDMWLEGIFRLALRRIEKGDWAAAALALDRAASLVMEADRARGHEFSGRERYFRARAWIQTGEVERGLAELEAIIIELPLSYYMLHAYSRLVARDAKRARGARDRALAWAKERPFSFSQRPEYELPGFVRALELLRQGEFDLARLELDALGLLQPNAAPAALWGVALLYERAGAPALSHGIARSLLTDWLEHWPAGDWLKAWQLAFPQPYPKLVKQAADSAGIPESLAYAVMREESAFDAGATSPANAHGLMQLIVPTAKTVARPLGLPYDANSLKRPSVNVRLGCTLLGQLEKRFSDNPLLAIPAYNAGPGRPTRWLREQPQVDFDIWVELIPITETRRYTKRVLASRAAYSFLYQSELAEQAMQLPTRLVRRD